MSSVYLSNGALMVIALEQTLLDIQRGNRNRLAGTSVARFIAKVVQRSLFWLFLPLVWAFLHIFIALARFTTADIRRTALSVMDLSSFAKLYTLAVKLYVAQKAAKADPIDFPDYWPLEGLFRTFHAEGDNMTSALFEHLFPADPDRPRLTPEAQQAERARFDAAGWNDDEDEELLSGAYIEEELEYRNLIVRKILSGKAA